jgi:hypothetical protein
MISQGGLDLVSKGPDVAVAELLYAHHREWKEKPAFLPCYDRPSQQR